ncbi:MAG: cation:proton antiporter [Chitinophagaceae bacterium]|nr:cation:proton antiporter [Chitinophagaceae bacterium]
MIDFFRHFMEEFRLPLVNPVLIFSLILFIILLSPVLLRKFNIPGIIGLIISGVIIGPHGLNILAKNSAVDLFSTIGLLYIMFIAGLELDLHEFKAHKNKSAVFGLFTFIVPLAIGYPVMRYMLGYNFDASFLTASMFATHTLVTYPIVSRMGISKDKAVAITVGGTIFTDTAVLIILAIILAVAQGNLNAEFWLRMGISMAIFLAIMFLVIPRIAKWFFRSLESEKHSHYIFVLAVVFFAAFLAEVAGVEPIIGAFVAGLALNKLIPHSSALMNRIEFIGNSLFIPFFLISVGMIVNLKVILSGTQALIIAGALSVVALTGKWLAAWLTQISFRFSSAQRQLIFGLSGAHAAATLAVVLVGYRANILDENILNGTIILILIACVVASFATEKAAKKIIAENDRNAPEQPQAFSLNNEHILMPVSNIDRFEKLLEFSILIKSKNSSSPISILTIVSNDSEAEANIIKSRNVLENFIKMGSAAETKVRPITTIDHNDVSGITRVSKETMANIIVMEWPPRTNFMDILIGEKMDKILTRINKTIFICNFENPLVLNKRIVIAAPPFSEKEDGFDIWMAKVARLAQELTIPIHVFSDQRTRNAVEKFMKKSRFAASISFKNFTHWEDFLILSKEITDDDLFILASSRNGGASYMSLLDGLPHKMEKYFVKNSKVVIYPQQFSQSYDTDLYEDISVAPLTRGLETIQRIGKDIGHIFKRDED